MLRWTAIALPVAALLWGCTLGATWPVSPPRVEPVVPNPMYVAVADRDLLWNTLVDVVDDDFQIQREERIRQDDDVLVEGRLETQPKVGASVLEPWHDDAVTPYDRWEGTLQSIRRRAQVRVIPATGGFLVEVAVFKELENVGRPDLATASAATFRHDTSLERFAQPVAAQPAPAGWIPLGRDVALEQKMLTKLRNRLAGLY